MRAFLPGLVLTIAALIPNVGNAQVYQFRTPPPDVSAAGADWQINGEPIVVEGLTYYPTRAFRLFDGQVMAQTGMYENVPVYADMTIEPFTEVYVPLGGGRMRLYERRRERELAGTEGSHVPTFPVASPSVPPPPERNVGTSGVMSPRETSSSRGVSDSASMSDRSRPRPTVMMTALPPSGGANGVWLQFDGARWYSSGTAAPYSPDRFELIGQYHGFPVYRDKMIGSDEIWVAVVEDGPLAPYRKK
jgi:hypothetical protein